MEAAFIVEFERGKYNICGYTQLSLRVLETFMKTQN